MRLLLLLFAAALTFGQSPAPFSTGEFSLKPCRRGGYLSGSEANGKVERQVPVAEVLMLAYDIPDFGIDGPGWIWQECVNYWQVPDKRYSPDVYRPALKRELSSQLHLSAHMELKVRDVFILKQATDGRVFKMQRSDCVNGEAAPYIRRVQVTAMPLSFAVQSFSTALRRQPVLDETGLAGCFSFDITWADEKELPRVVSDQLGLELQSAKRRIETLVIDHLERWPSAPDGK